MDATKFMRLPAAEKLYRKDAGGDVAESRMQALAVVEDLNVFGDLENRMLLRFVASVDMFILYNVSLTDRTQ